MKMIKQPFLMMAALLLSASPLPTTAQTPDTPVSQMEKLGRGVVALRNGQGEGNFISWRLLGTDDYANTTFNLYRDGTLIAEGLHAGTCFTDETGTADNRYKVETLVNGATTELSDEVTPWADIYKTIRLQKPDPSVNNNAKEYTPNDISVGDADGDGEYELFVKWDPAGTMASQDNSKKGKTGNVVIDCYKLDGTRLWSVNLGPNIRAGAHYTQFLVYDFDGDGKTEMICKTAPWSKDGEGNYVNKATDNEEISSASNTTSHRNSSGYVLSGQEYLTVFDGATGRAINTIFYNPNRAGGLGGEPSGSSKSFWGNNYGNRCDRFLATVAYLDGPDARPSAVMGRGYYTRAYVWAVDFDGSKLSTKWLHSSVSKSEWNLTDAEGNITKHTGLTATAYGNGNHNLSCADVDGDGKDEILYGSCAVDNDGSLLYSTGLGHGDAMHVSDLIPSRPGLEVYTVHEDAPYGFDVHDARTGEILFHNTSTEDDGRGLAADVDSTHEGFECWDQGLKNVFNISDQSILSTSYPRINFRIYWDGDLYDETFDDVSVEKWQDNKRVVILNTNAYNKSHSCNGTKRTPNLQADLFGDWREEIVEWSTTDSCSLNIFTTTYPTDYRIPTLMHDHVYRMGITWQQTAYNQPPHLGYYLPQHAASFTSTGIESVKTTELTNADANAPTYNLSGQRVGPDFKGLVIQNGRKQINK